MGFRDAFWSSTLPKETLNDIQRLRNGVDNAMNPKLSPGGISLLQHVDGNGENRQDLV
jgi:hypothetical protein